MPSGSTRGRRTSSSGAARAGTEQTKLLGSDTAAFDFFGVDVAIDGDTAVVGAWNSTVAGKRRGAVYVFVRSGTAWTQQAKLVASDGAKDDEFGKGVAISGNTVIVGATADDDVAPATGSAYIFVRSGTSWTEQAKLVSFDAEVGDFAAEDVSISGDTAVVAVENDDDDGFRSGSVYVYVRSGPSWSLQQKLTASDAMDGDTFGRDVSIDGNTLVVGADLGDSPLGLNRGTAYVFTRSGTTWTEQTKLYASDGESSDNFGISVALSDNAAVIGANADDDAAFNAGAAYVFRRTGTTWMEYAKLLASDGDIVDLFGGAVAVDGGTVAVGARNNTDFGTRTGAAYVYFDPDLVPAVGGSGIGKVQLRDTAEPGLLARWLDMVLGLWR